MERRREERRRRKEEEEEEERGRVKGVYLSKARVYTYSASQHYRTTVLILTDWTR